MNAGAAALAVVFAADLAPGAGLALTWDALPAARLVGGCVRDAVLGVAAADIDLATPLPPDAVIQAARAAGLRAVPTGLSHGTVTVVAAGRGFEVTTLRRDIATDGRHAQVEFTDDWRADAARRDFTFNAMTLDRGFGLHDPFGGVADLAAGIVRFVGDPAARLAEDRLRALRYLRFYARYAAQPPDPATLAALAGTAGSLHLLSAERVWGELTRILAAPDPTAALALAAGCGILAAVLPEATGTIAGLLSAGAPADPLLRLAALVAAPTGALAARLKLSGEQADRLAALHAGPVPMPDDDDDALRRQLADAPAALLIDRVWLAGGDPALRARLAAIAPPVFPLAGRDALAAGMPPGPAVGQALRAVRDWWLAGGCRADQAACLARLRAG